MTTQKSTIIESLKANVSSRADRITKFKLNSSKTAKDKRTISFLNARLNLLESYWAQFVASYDELNEAVSSEERATVEILKQDIFSLVECAYTETISWLNAELEPLQPSHDSSMMNLTTTGSNNNAVRLPKINLPSFGGAYIEWPSFRDTYRSLIHDNHDIAEIQKMHYLKSSLTGDAFQLVQYLPITSGNYKAAWEILINRYDNTRVLVNTNIAALVTIPNMSSETAPELRRVFDSFTQAVKTLENLKRPIEHWDDWFTYFLSNKLDSVTRKDWETSLKSSTHTPQFASLKTFLEGRIHTLNALTPNLHIDKRNISSHRTSPTVTRSHHSALPQVCSHCNRNHFILFCRQFRSKNPEERLAVVQTKRLCTNCLRIDHKVTDCQSNNRCQLCQQKHHTMVHKAVITQKPDDLSSPPATSLSHEAETPLVRETSAHLSNNSRDSSSVLLATAMVLIKSTDGRVIKARALIDPGSESNFTTTSLANLLRLPKHKAHVVVKGVNKAEVGRARTAVSYEVISTVNQHNSVYVESLLLPSVTHLLPTHDLPTSHWPHLQGLSLADPEFHTPARIDLLLGAGIYAEIIQSGVLRGPAGSPTAQLTSLGWILLGSVRAPTSPTTLTLTCHTSSIQTDALLRKFWETEELPAPPQLTPAEAECEQHFIDTHYRTPEGRYVVHLPLRLSRSSLGDSRRAALATLYRLERRFVHDPQLREDYTKFMDEYSELGHLEPVQPEDSHGNHVYYLPHHAVLKMSSTTTKLRVVFNASQRSSTGISLNDILHIGPKLQTDVRAVILRWRLFQYVFTSDAEKMYRQILVDTQDTDLQRILWRSSPTQPVQCYRLNTVTYGTACAPYLACRIFQQIANDYDTKYPLGASVLRKNFYVDDALFGSSNLHTAIQIRNELRHVLQLCGFKLRKWLSNHPDLLADIPEQDKESVNAPKLLRDTQISALGIKWDPSSDRLSCKIQVSSAANTTKRSILSTISQIYDPLGWLSPTTIKAKIFLQQLWLAKSGWDDNLPDTIVAAWVRYKADLSQLHDVTIPRWVGIDDSYIGLELHGFCDASLSAYGAAVYLRVIQDYNIIQVSLLAAKTRVSPLKTISLPRLELCGATLLAELVSYVQDSLDLQQIPVHAWSDSTVVLAWLREHPARWKVFVANRVSLIHQKLPHATWRHVLSEHNPADCLTKGISVEQLKIHSLWWSGPQWLTTNSTTWPLMPTSTSSAALVDEEKRPNISLLSRDEADDFPLISRYSNLRKLLRVTAYCCRFYANAKSNSDKLTGHLTIAELNSALSRLIRLVQSHSFRREISRLASGKALPASSSIIRLNPIVDKDGILRVSGRLTNSLLPWDEKYPIILPKDTHLTQLLIDHAHTATLHGGIQLTLHRVRTKYWIMSGRSKVRQFVRNCIVCLRYSARPATQIMADLPRDRVRPAKPFSTAGVDYAGPFSITPVKGRGSKVVKSYIALFICFVTRAVHIELVMDLTSEAFIAAFRRFISRRGYCSKLYSDNATTFVAANKELGRQFQCALREAKIPEALLNDGTDWQYIPPASPHFGGLWEAGVKSYKHHLRRVVGDHILSVEEMLTLTTQVEACLNSRPLYALSDDPKDISALTPAHFLTGGSLSTVPTPTRLDCPSNRLTRWELVQRMYEDIWSRWYKEYIHHLQLRHTWFHAQTNLKCNDLVLIKDDKLPPSKWLLGRVIEVHPGPDGNIRVVTVRHKDGLYKRSITKLCVLPVHSPN